MQSKPPSSLCDHVNFVTGPIIPLQSPYCETSNLSHTGVYFLNGMPSISSIRTVKRSLFNVTVSPSLIKNFGISLLLNDESDRTQPQSKIIVWPGDKKEPF